MNLLERAKEFNREHKQMTSYGALKLNVDARNRTISDDDIITYKGVIAEWKQGVYTKDDVRAYNGTITRCVQAHDSTNDPTHTPTVASLWTVLHGRTPETAQKWVQPLGSHDQYLVGEYCIHDGTLYKCVSDTTYAPDAPNVSPPAEALAWVRDGENIDSSPHEPEEPNEPITYPEWKQPTSENPYKIGDIVMFNGKLYKSKINGNVWSPTGYAAGWEEVK